jgi:hypothetical protein
MVAVSLTFPEPEGLNPVAPPDPKAVQVSEVKSGFEARGSEIDVPTASEGPEFEATIV